MFDIISNQKWKNRSTFSVEEAGCEILGLSKVSAYAAANRGDLPTVRIGRRLLVPRLALENLLKSAEPHSPPDVDPIKLVGELRAILDDQRGEKVDVEFDRWELTFLINLLAREAANAKA